MTNILINVESGSDLGNVVVLEMLSALLARQGYKVVIEPPLGDINAMRYKTGEPVDHQMEIFKLRNECRFELQNVEPACEIAVLDKTLMKQAGAEDIMVYMPAVAEILKGSLKVGNLLVDAVAEAAEAVREKLRLQEQAEIDNASQADGNTTESN